MDVSGSWSARDEALGQKLIEQGQLTDKELSRLARMQQGQQEAVPLTRLLLNLGMMSERELARTLAEQHDLPLTENDRYPLAPPLDKPLPYRFLKEHHLVPLHQDDTTLVLAMVDPGDDFALQAMTMLCGQPVRAQVGISSEIDAAIERLYGEGQSKMGDILSAVQEEEETEERIAQLKDMASEAPVIRLVNLLIQKAVELRASDIHVEPFENRLNIRYRIDGVLQQGEAPPVNMTPAIISRIKILARLNIAERRLPQDGRIELRVQGQDLDIRVSTVPTMHGESLVMRLLNRESVVLDFDALGFASDTRARLQQVLAIPHGVLLVTGPTGSGKTTTLYTALNRLNTTERKLITVEDPVEYQMEGINQIHVKPAIGLTFASALRAIVRQDPDVIMVGEMRDLETARICVQSALTGHLVLSTLHTNDAASSVTRLLEMGVEDYLLTSTLNGVVGQRLIRVLCPHCKESYEPLPELVRELKLEPLTPGDPVRLYRPVGCNHCAHTGYHGRLAIQELLVMNDDIRKLVLSHADAGQIQRAAVAAGMRTMYGDGLLKAQQGITNVEEVIRVTQEA
ncbi:type II secretion system ATPase GspE [Oceanimonas sp. CHS3-5]|uniref:type II secretion system ATPase GspE n=1 Tax=Oceanimonas sp. CHS3-5 TaxID=3068186 RepID=UPI00273DE98E|nr:type II secretion system ATPase GspE [Oceanimonas sp. CHS3-5]MDP5293434.1 type II secretion system ATPase GspE [Oceanimonas sp. CHS3-5]